MIKIGNSDISQAFLGTINIIAAYLGELQIFGSETSQYLTFEAAADNCQIKFYAVNSSNTKTILVSTDKNTWTSKTSSTSGTVLATLNSGLKLYVKGNNSAYSNSNGYSNSILPTANCYVYGNIMSLIDGDNFKTLTTISTSYAFKDLFNSSRYSSSTNSLFILKKSRKNIVLPATTLADYCYESMFLGCTSLTNAPELPATTLASYCYGSMFYGCSSLTSVPELPATTLDSYCYDSMFYNCTSLTSAPELPATTLANYCYSYMFYGCSSLTSAPNLFAIILQPYCYYLMFNGCSNLNYIRCLALDIPINGYCTDNWVNGVAYTGTFVKNIFMNDWKNGVNGIPTNWEIENYYAGLKLLSAGETTVSLSNTGGNAPSLDYSFNNGVTWTQWDYSSITLHDGDELCVKGNNLNGFSSSSSIYSNFVFSGTGTISASGNIMSLLDNGRCALTSIPNNYCFYHLFYNCRSLTSAPELPATMLTRNCYESMFLDCTSLANAPELPATTLAYYCYSKMFRGCSSLTSVPELPATTLALSCYHLMFSSCSSLTNVPELPATTLASRCYNGMFLGCSSLTSAPELPATTLANYCYSGMFYSCTSLTDASELPATTLDSYCYYLMFENCSSLTNAPKLPAITLADYCYYNMFRNCISLTSAPELPATTLASYCYGSMFYNCSSLTSAPELPATTLVSSCYKYMFYGCYKLSYIKCLATTGINENDSTTNWVSGVASTGIFIKDPNTTWPTGNNGVPSGWTTINVGTLVFKSTGNSTIGLLYKSSVHSLEYSLDNITWTNMTISTNIQLTDKQLVSIRGILSGDLSTSNRTQFKMTGSIEALGNCNALWNYNDLSASLKQYCGFKLFYGCTSLTNAPELPATTLTSSCYNSMFYNCSSLTSAPELPATILAYGCYSNMFYNCSSLISAPELPATTLADWCYTNMFYNCSSLTSAPELPATTLAIACYYLMFFACHNLNHIKCLATTGINENDSTTGWVSGVASTGTFIKDPNTTWPTGTSGIPANWTVQPAA